jgi:hypothetical protein
MTYAEAAYIQKQQDEIDKLKKIIQDTTELIANMVQGCRHTWETYDNIDKPIKEEFCESFGHTSLFRVAKPLLDSGVVDQKAIFENIRLKELERCREGVTYCLNQLAVPREQLSHYTDEQWEQRKQNYINSYARNLDGIELLSDSTKFNYDLQKEVNDALGP